TGPKHSFILTLGGVMDAASAGDPIGYAASVQRFEPMRSVRLENTGDQDIVDPWITVNGRRNWRTAKDIVEEALRTYGDPARMTDAEKARAVWEYQRHHRFHATTGDAEVRDPVKLYNVYGYTLCGDEAPAIADLWRLAGLKTRDRWPMGHVVTEVWYDEAWHVLDSDQHGLYLLRDNRTIAGVDELIADHDLVKRTHNYGILSPDNRRVDEFVASVYGNETKRWGDHRSNIGHTMTFTLRPGEAIEWRWDHQGKYHTSDEGLKEGWGDAALARLRNGKWTYRPDLRAPYARAGVAAAENVRWSTDPGGPALAPAGAGPASVVWRIASPYGLVGGKLRAKGDGKAYLSFDQKTWSPLPGLDADLDPFFPRKGPARYAYFLRIDLGTGLHALAVENDLQMAALGLPSLDLGPNTIAYVDQTRGPRSARLTFEWVERAGPPAPAPPAAPLSPADGGSIAGTRIAFRWSPSASPKVIDYHVQLSDQPDLRWVLSADFDKLVSRTADAGKAQYTLPEAGLLNPGQRYYWRVRAKDDRHLWGPWSRIWSFTPQAPGVPLRLRWENEGRRLSWTPNPDGRPPVRYEIHASDEKGFTAGDRERQVYAGNQKEGGLFPGREFVTMPSTRRATSTTPFLDLRPSHAFYRVVAVDAEGHPSGVSDALAARRPFIYSEPPPEGPAGSAYRYEVKTIRSIGDLRCRMFGGSLYNAAFWDAEKPRFAMTRGPAWLAMDPDTGVLTGRRDPADAREHDVQVTVEIPGVGTDQQTFRLRRPSP
ncbi:MAG TPA: fibronectin type III domain-containing protein, partial [Planctomycetota bacterium]|nr:fibronectin type III domain-containing protein [Planctomycetota bacterium]